MFACNSKKLKFIAIFIPILFSISFFPKISFPDVSVPQDLAELAAVHYGEELYGPLQVFFTEIYYNLSNEPIFYCVVCFRGKGAMPSIKEVKNRIWKQDGRIEELKADVLAINDLDISGKKKAARQSQIHEKIIKEGRIMSGTDDFATAYVSANEANVPVPRFSDGLPDIWLMMPVMKEVMEEKKMIFPEEQARIYATGLYHFKVVPGPQTFSSKKSGVPKQLQAFDLMTRKIVEIETGDRKNVRPAPTPQIDAKTQRMIEERRKKHAELVEGRWDKLKAILKPRSAN